MAVSSAGQVAERDAPFQLRGNSFTMMVLKVVDPAAPSFFPLLGGKVRQAPNFFRHAPVVLDFQDLQGETLDLGGFVAGLSEHHLRPVGFQGGPPAVQQAALAQGLIPMPTGRPTSLEGARPETRASSPVAAPAVPAPAPEPVYRPTLIVTEPVRSGQQIYAEKTDLIVAAAVSAGAEVLADGSIHVYGPLRGRALAGISGDGNARIFCQSLEAEVISIAGLYQVSEDIAAEVRKKAVHVQLSNGYLLVQPL